MKSIVFSLLLMCIIKIEVVETNEYEQNNVEISGFIHRTSVKDSGFRHVQHCVVSMPRNFLYSLCINQSKVCRELSGSDLTLRSSSSSLAAFYLSINKILPNNKHHTLGVIILNISSS